MMRKSSLGVAPHAAGAAAAPSGAMGGSGGLARRDTGAKARPNGPSASRAQLARTGWRLPRPFGAQQQAHTLAMLRVTAHELRPAVGTRPGESLPRQREALLQLAHFMRRAEPSQLGAISRSAVVPALISTIDALSAPAERERAGGASLGAIGAADDDGAPRIPVLNLAEPKVVAVGLSAVANLLYIGGHALAVRAGALELLARLAPCVTDDEVQSYALATMQNLSALPAYVALLRKQPQLLAMLREVAAIVPEGDPRFYYAAGALTNVVQAAAQPARKRTWPFGGGPGFGASSPPPLAAAPSAADEEMAAIIERRQQLKLRRAAVRCQAHARARRARVRLARARRAATRLQAAARAARARRELARHRAAAVTIQRVARPRFRPRPALRALGASALNGRAAAAERPGMVRALTRSPGFSTTKTKPFAAAEAAEQRHGLAPTAKHRLVRAPTMPTLGRASAQRPPPPPPDALVTKRSTAGRALAFGSADTVQLDDVRFDDIRVG